MARNPDDNLTHSRDLDKMIEQTQPAALRILDDRALAGLLRDLRAMKGAESDNGMQKALGQAIRRAAAEKRERAGREPGQEQDDAESEATTSAAPAPAAPPAPEPAEPAAPAESGGNAEKRAELKRMKEADRAERKRAKVAEREERKALKVAERDRAKSEKRALKAASQPAGGKKAKKADKPGKAAKSH